MNTKTCTKCKEKLNFNCFYKDISHNDNLSSSCKKCRKEHHQQNKEKIAKQRQKIYYRNRDKILKKRRKQYQKNNEKELERCRKYRKNNPHVHKEYEQRNAEKIAKRKKIYYQKNKEKIKLKEKNYYKNNKEIKNKYARNRRKIDLNFKIRCNLGSRITKVIKGKYKSAHTMELLGCNIEDFKSHIESQFTVGMTWENYGFKGWHIDHIIPCDSFDLTNESQQRICFNYKNLQPLWWLDNLSKGAKIL